MLQKTLYIWDLADTLFIEYWDQKKSGVKNFKAYLKSLGYNLRTIKAIDYENSYHIPFTKNILKFKYNSGALKMLNWAKHNGVFTTGHRKQLGWRAVQLKHNHLPDFRKFFHVFYSTFDYGNTNKKNFQMYKDILQKSLKLGFTTIVYADNNYANCNLFISAAARLKKQISRFNYRLYYIRPNVQSLKGVNSHKFIASNFQQIIKNEKSLNKLLT